MNAIKNTIINILRRILPGGIRNKFFHLSFHLAHPEFEKFAHKYARAPNMEFGLTAMAERGFLPMAIVDVGAFEGRWSKMAKQIWPSAQLFMIEPNVEKKTLLLEIAKDLNARFFCELLGAENDREVEFHLMESGSSVMEERSAVPRKVEIHRLKRLDSILSDIPSPALLKIDAQGYELEILKGCSEIMSAFGAVLLEIAIIEINKGAPLLHEVVAFMKDRGFIAYDILEIHRRPLDGALNQVDIIFITEQSPLIADKRHF